MPVKPRTRAGSGRTLTGSSDISRVLREGSRRTGRVLVVYAFPSGRTTRAGYASPRSIGGAVARNRVRRLMREAWRAVQGSVREGFDVMIVGRPEVRGASLDEVATDLERLLEEAGVTA